MKLTGIISALFFIACFMALNTAVWATASLYGQSIGQLGMYLILLFTAAISILFTAQVWDDLITAKVDSDE